MNRSAKRHRSTKVPNVKLRPAPIERSDRWERQHREAEAEKEDLAHYRRVREAHRTGKARLLDSEDEQGSIEDDEGDNDEGCEDDRGPLLGCVICMTGIGEEKAKLTEYATMLGAQVQGDLTEDATHLIANEPGSDKYRCALKLGLPILRSEWLRELRARWTEAVQYDFDGLMEEHRLDTFDNLCVALAGITDASERTELRRKLRSGSAKTPTTFALDGCFTHLVCGDVKDSKTMEVVNRFRRKAERFTRRGETLPADGEANATEMRAATKLRIVWKEWVEDCLEVQGSIDEHFYAVEEPRLTLAQRKELKESILHEKSVREKTNQDRILAAKRLTEPTKGRLARVEAAETQSGSSGGGVNEVQRAKKKPKMDLNKYVQQLAREEEERPASAKPHHSSLSKAHSFADSRQGVLEDAKKVDESVSVPVQRKRPEADEDEEMENLTLDRGYNDKGDDHDHDHEEGDALLEEDPASGLHSHFREKSLSSLSFRVDLRNDERNQAAKKALEIRGVKSVLGPLDPGLAHFHILPLGRVASLKSGSSSSSSSDFLGTPVTHLFIERCLFESRVLGLNESFALQPSAVDFPLPGSENVFVGLTGFAAEEDIDRKQLEIALRSAGIESSSTLKRGYHTHLLVGREASVSESSRIKVQKAKEWGIHCVGLDFVDKIYRHGKIEPPVSRREMLQRLLGRGVASRGASIGASMEATQKQPSPVSAREGAVAPLEVNEQVSNVASTNMSRPWQRSASGSQALLDGEESRGMSFRYSNPRYHNVDSLEAGSMAIKTSAEEVMALLNNRSRGEVTNGAVSSSSTGRKRGRLPPSRLRERRAGSAIVNQLDRTPSENMSAEDVLAMRREEEEERQLVVGAATQATQSGAQESESVRITYDDPSSRRERRKIGEMIATSVKHLQATRQDDNESTRSSSTEMDEEAVLDLRTSSASPSKGRATRPPFRPTIQARRQPGTCNRD